MPLLSSRTGRLALIGATLCWAAPALAQQAEAGREEPPTIGTPCVVVEVASSRAGDLECAARRAEKAARIVRAQAETIRAMSVERAGSPDVRVGVSSLSGTRLRMGSNLGRSVRPQRPAPIPANPRGPRR